MLNRQSSLIRQSRLLEVIASRRLDAVVVGLSHHVYYFSAFLPAWHHQAAFLLFADGRSLLISPNSAAQNMAADDVRAYEANWAGTLRQEQPSVIAGLAIDALQSHGAKRVGIDSSPVSSQLMLQSPGSYEAVDPDLWQMRRAKDADELGLMEKAIRCTEAMYTRAKQIIEPGVLETHVYGQLHEAAVTEAGEAMTAILGNDYSCGAGGGPPKGGKAAKAGELYVLDLGPAYRGYFADNCRAFSVDRKSTDAQLKAWQIIVGTFPIIERMARPGVRCRDIYDAVDQHFKDARGNGLAHHLGHGVGLQPHEFPHLNPNWDDTLIEGEIFTAEPGIYGPELAGGIRIENDYLVTKDGVKNLLNYPMELV